MEEKKMMKLKNSQQKMSKLIHDLENCQDRQKAKKLEAKLERLINKNVELVLSK